MKNSIIDGMNLFMGPFRESSVQRGLDQFLQPKKSFEENSSKYGMQFVVGGGKLLNYDGHLEARESIYYSQKGIGKGKFLAGGSAGSLCWFEMENYRLQTHRMSVWKGLGFLPY